MKVWSSTESRVSIQTGRKIEDGNGHAEKARQVLYRMPIAGMYLIPNDTVLYVLYHYIRLFVLLYYFVIYILYHTFWLVNNVLQFFESIEHQGGFLKILDRHAHI